MIKKSMHNLNISTVIKIVILYVIPLILFCVSLLLKKTLAPFCFND